MKNQSVNKNLTNVNNNSQLSELSKSENENPSKLYKKIFRCLNCNIIPIITLQQENTLNPKVIIDCINGHHNELNLIKFMEKNIENSMNKVKCSKCGNHHEHKKKFKLCEECQKIFCKQCKKEHLYENESHHLLSIKKVDIICSIHKRNFTKFCDDCSKNICDECIETHKNHKIKEYNKIKNLDEIKENIQKELEELNKVSKLFYSKIENLTKKFEHIMEIKYSVIRFKNNIVNTYELKNTNNQIITNLSKLQFKDKKYNINPNLNDINTIDEIFKLFEKQENNQKDKNKKNDNIIKEKEIPKSLNQSKKLKKNSSAIIFNKIKEKITNNKNSEIGNKIEEIAEIKKLSKNKSKNDNDENIVKEEIKQKLNKEIKEEIKNEEYNIKKNSKTEDNLRQKKTKKIKKSKKSKTKDTEETNEQTKEEIEPIQKIEEKENTLKKNYSTKFLKNIKHEKIETEMENEKKFTRKISKKTKKINQENQTKNEEKIVEIKQSEEEKPQNSFDIKNNQNQNKQQINIELPFKQKEKLKNLKLKKENNKHEIENLLDKNDSEQLDIIISNNNSNYIPDEFLLNEKIIQSYDEIPEKQLYDSLKQRSKENKIPSISPKNIKEEKTDQEQLIQNLQTNKNDIKNFEIQKKLNLENNSIAKLRENVPGKIHEAVKLNKPDIFDIEESDIQSPFSKKNSRITEKTEEENIEEKEKPNETKRIIKIITKKPIFIKIEEQSESVSCENSNNNNENIQIFETNNLKNKLKKIKQQNLGPNVTNTKTGNYNENYLPSRDFNRQKMEKKFNEKFINNYNYKSYDNKNKNDILPNVRFSSDDIQKMNNNFNETNLICSKKKIFKIELNNSINCIAEINPPEFFALGNSIGEIIIFDNSEYKLIQKIKEHKDSINSLFLLHDNSMLSASNDKTMKKIRFINNCKSYKVEYIFSGFKNILKKGIELSNNKIICNSFKEKITIFQKSKGGNIIENSICHNEAINDILEISKYEFAAVGENKINFWDNVKLVLNHSIKNIFSNFNSQNLICKIKDDILAIGFNNQIQLIDLVKYELINNFIVSNGDLYSVIKLKNNSILFSEIIKNDSYCEFNTKQYIIEDDQLFFISSKKEKYSKKNCENQIKVVYELSNGTIIEGINKVFNKKETGEIILYY